MSEKKPRTDLIAFVGTVLPGPAGTIILDTGTRRVFLQRVQIILGEDLRSVIVPQWLAKKKNLI